MYLNKKNFSVFTPWDIACTECPFNDITGHRCLASNINYIDCSGVNYLRRRNPRNYVIVFPL